VTSDDGYKNKKAEKPVPLSGTEGVKWVTIMDVLNLNLMINTFRDVFLFYIAIKVIYFIINSIFTKNIVFIDVIIFKLTTICYSKTVRVGLLYKYIIY